MVGEVEDRISFGGGEGCVDDAGVWIRRWCGCEGAVDKRGVDEKGCDERGCGRERAWTSFEYEDEHTSGAGETISQSVDMGEHLILAPGGSGFVLESCWSIEKMIVWAGREA
jgi:hypothetical protein